MTKLKFVVSLMTDDNDYQLEQARSAEAMAVKLGIEQQILYAENDAVTQSTQLFKMIQVPPEKRPQAIVCEPVGGTAMQAVARAAVTAGIGWAVLNRDVDYITELQRTARVPVFCVSPPGSSGEFKRGSAARCCPRAERRSICKGLRTVPSPKKDC